MAIYEDGSYSSTPGIALLAKVLAGRCKLVYTRAAAGKGTISEGENPKTMTEPAGYVMDASIVAVTNPTDGECQVTVQINSDNVTSGFYCTGIVLYAEDPDDGEIPFTYLVLENGPEWIRPSSSTVGKVATFDLIAAVGDVSVVSATLDPNAIVTRSIVDQLIAGVVVQRDITIPASGWESVSEEDEVESGYGLYIDVGESDVTDTMIPMVSVLPEYYNVAKTCALATAVRSIDGAIRFYAEKEPTEDMQATLTILAASAGAANSGSSSITESYVLPTATASRLGGIKVGDGLSVSADGTLSVDGEAIINDVAATDEDVTEALDEIYSTTDD